MALQVRGGTCIFDFGVNCPFKTKVLQIDAAEKEIWFWLNLFCDTDTSHIEMLYWTKTDAVISDLQIREQVQQPGGVSKATQERQAFGLLQVR